MMDIEQGGNEDQLLQYRIAKLELRPGDILVLKVLRHVSAEEAARIAERFQQFVGIQCRVVVIDEVIDLSVVRREEAQEGSNIGYPGAVQGMDGRFYGPPK
jgi:hypothetical protein